VTSQFGLREDLARCWAGASREFPHLSEGNESIIFTATRLSNYKLKAQCNDYKQTFSIEM
jgi:hypothetical protein